MNERLVAYNLSLLDPTDDAGMGASACVFMVPFGATLVYASAAPHENDGGATIDIQDDGTDIVTALTCAVAGTPGEWISTHCGGTETPVDIAAGSEMEIDANAVAATTRLDITLLFLHGAAEFASGRRRYSALTANSAAPCSPMTNCGSRCD